jgi:hypothetical protein
LGEDEFVLVVGTNHNTTGHAVYSNFGVYNGMTSVTGIDNSAFPGSTAYFLPEYPVDDMLYVYKIARDCDDSEYCLSVSEEQLPLNTTMMIGARPYLERSTFVSPDPNELIWPIAMKFKRPTP